MDLFTTIINKFGDDPLQLIIFAAGFVLVVLAIAFLFRIRSDAAQVQTAMGQLGTTSAALLTSQDERIKLERTRGEQSALLEKKDADIDRLNQQIETLRVEVQNLARDAGRVDALEKRVDELQNRADNLQLELDAEKRKSAYLEGQNAELQKRLNEVQAELDTLRAKASSETQTLRTPEFGDRI